jgi:uncharacterized protein
MKELSDSGKIIVKGSFIDGQEDGQWFSEVNNCKENGTYRDGKKEGVWKTFIDGKLSFEGNYVDGLPDGLHTYYWGNGKTKEKGKYIAGKKEGDWILYDEEGLKLITITYEDGEDVSYDGVKIDKTPPK